MFKGQRESEARDAKGNKLWTISKPNGKGTWASNSTKQHWTIERNYFQIRELR